MSTEETDIRIEAENTGLEDTEAETAMPENTEAEETEADITEPEDIEASEQPAEEQSFGVTAYIDIQESNIASQDGDASQYKKTIMTGLLDIDAQEEGGSTGADTDISGTRVIPAKDIEAGTEGEASAEKSEDGRSEEEPGDGSAEGEDTTSEEKDPEIEAIKRKIIERKREKRRKAQLRRVRFWTILTVLLVSIAALIFSLSSFFTVDSIEVRGNSRFTAEEIINIAHAVPGHNIIYNPGTAEITEYLEQNPFIKSATVTRKLPSTLVITVNERKQACAFKYDDDYLVMDDEGILLSKTRTEPKITMLNGLVATKIKLGETIGTKNQQMFSKVLKLIRETAAGDLYFVRIDLSDYEESNQVRAYVYDKLVVKSDYDLLMENVTNGRLHKVLEKLFEDGVKRGTITLNADGTAGFEPGI